MTLSDFSFKERATADPVKPLNDLLVVELTIQNIDIARILVDTRSSADMICKSTLGRMGICPSRIAEDLNPVVGLSGEATMTLGTINLSVKAGSMTKIVEFLVIDRPVSCNVNSMVEFNASSPVNIPHVSLIPNPLVESRTSGEIRESREYASPQN